MRVRQHKKQTTAKAEPGDVVSSDYVAQRRKIETQLHRPNDDGTEQIFLKRVGGKKLYSHKTGEPLSDHDDPARLCEFGLSIRDIARLEENGCEEIADVRSAALSETEIPGWQNCGPVTLQNVRTALKNADEAKRRKKA